MAEPKLAKSSVASPRDTQTENIKSLGGMPPQLDAEKIMKVNTPMGRSPAPDSFRPK